MPDAQILGLADYVELSDHAELSNYVELSDYVEAESGLPAPAPQQYQQGSGIVPRQTSAPSTTPPGNTAYRIYSMYPVEQLGDGYERLASLVLSEKLANGEDIAPHRRLELLRLSGLPDPWHDHPVTGMVFFASSDELGKGGVFGSIGDAISGAAKSVGGVVQKVVSVPVRIAQQVAKPVASLTKPIINAAAPILSRIPGVGPGVAVAATGLVNGLQNLSNLQAPKTFKDWGTFTGKMVTGIAGISGNIKAMSGPPPMEGGPLPSRAGSESINTAAPPMQGVEMPPAGWSLPSGPGGATGAPGTYVADPQTAAMMAQMTDQALGQVRPGAEPKSGPNYLLLGGGAAALAVAFILFSQPRQVMVANPGRRRRSARRRRR